MDSSAWAGRKLQNLTALQLRHTEGLEQSAKARLLQTGWGQATQSPEPVTWIFWRQIANCVPLVDRRSESGDQAP